METSKMSTIENKDKMSESNESELFMEDYFDDLTEAVINDSYSNENSVWDNV